MARYVDPDVWRDLRRALREIRADTYLLAEVMGDAGAWLQGDAFDASMNYPLRELALRFLATGAIDGREVMDGLARLSARHAWPVMQAAHNLVGSHDTPRFLTLAGGELWRLRLAVVLQMTFPGASGLYYGDEVGMTGGGIDAALRHGRCRTSVTCRCCSTSPGPTLTSWRLSLCVPWWRAAMATPRRTRPSCWLSTAGSSAR